MPDRSVLEAMGAATDPSELIAGLAGSDPRMAMVLKMLEASRGPGPGPDADVAEDDAGEDDITRLVDALQERLARSEQRFARLRRKTRDLVEAHREALDRLADLAGALGACGRCWGQDPRCPACRGRGRPGMVRPDPALRAELFGRPGRRPEATEGQILPDHPTTGHMEARDAGRREL